MTRLIRTDMKLFYTPSSPYALCVRILIAELNIGEAIEWFETHPFDNQAEFVKYSPLLKVPCLVVTGDDGTDEVISDSEVICDYLDANITGGELFNSIYADWRLKSFYSICSGLMDASVARRIEMARKADDSSSAFWLERHTQAIHHGLKNIEQRLALMPEAFSILQINLLSGLAYLDFRHSDIDWRAAYPKLAEFEQQFKSRPCVSSQQLSD
jgi:glutathione S-transferase